MTSIQGNYHGITDSLDDRKSPILKSSVNARTVLWYLAFFGFAIDFMYRINLNIAIVDMIQVRKHHKTHFNTSECYIQQSNITSATKTSSTSLEINNLGSQRISIDGTINHATASGFDWDEYIQGLILGSFYWIYWISPIPGGILAQKYGTKLIFGMSNLIGCLSCFLIPISAYIDYRLLIVLRMVQGFFAGMSWPAMHTMTGKWIPPNERSKFVTAYLGSAIGIAMFYPVFGFIISISSWEWVFHVCGILGIVWFIFWQYYAYDSPAVHPRIHPSERYYIEKSLGNASGVNVVGPTPWKSILTSRFVWIIAIAQWANLWALFTCMTQGPTYFKNIHGWGIEMIGFLSGLPHLLRVIFSYAFSTYADYLLKSEKMSRTNVRKLAGTLACIINGFLMLGLAFSGCDSLMAIICLTLAVVVSVSSGPLANIIDLSPNYSGVILGISMVISATAGFMSAFLVGKLTLNDQTVQQWKYVFLITGGVLLLCGIQYVLFTKADLQRWNSPPCTVLQKPTEASMEVRHNNEENDADNIRKQ